MNDIFYQVSQGNINNIQLILERNGEDFIDSTKVRSGESCLHVAVASRQEEAVNFLFQKNQNWRLTNKLSGATVLHVAASNGFCDMIRLLMKHFSEKGCSEEELVALINGCDNNGLTPVHYAAINSHTTTLKTLIYEYKASGSVGSTSGDTPLHVACLWGQIDSVKMLLEGGIGGLKLDKTIDQNGGNKAGDTPLHKSVINSHGPIAEYLIYKGANMLKVNGSGLSPLDLANTDTIKLMNHR